MEDIVLLILIIVFVVLIIGLLIYLKINKKVTMKNFVGEPKESLNIWLKENGISNKNVIITYEYDSVYDENIEQIIRSESMPS